MDKYKIPKVNLSIKDGCKFKNNELILKSYQIIPLIHFKKYNSLLLYHSVGSGKTATAINIIKSYNSTHNIVIFIKAALHDGWLKELKLWKYNSDNIYFYHYDSINGFKEFNEERKKYKYKNTFYIIDEAHNFINNVYSNNKLNKIEGVGRQIYEYIYKEISKNQDKKTDKNSVSKVSLKSSSNSVKSNIKILLISATPIVNEPYELSILFNLLKPGCFPTSKSEFNSIYLKQDKGKVVINNKKDFQTQTKNLVSYYYGAIPNQYAVNKTKLINIEMSKYQEEVYLHYQLRELKDPANWDFYKIFSRQTSNFAMPYISKKVNGYSRPRPSTYGGETPEFGQDIMLHINSFEKYMYNFYDYDKKHNHIIADDFKNCNYNFDKIVDLINGKFTKDGKKLSPSKLLTAMYNSSAKFLNIVLKVLKSKGPVIIYTNFSMLEGIPALSIYFKFFGFDLYTDKNKNDKKYNNKRYVEFHGLIKKELRDYYKNEFNRPDNIRGELIKIFFVTSAGSEGITLYNVRQIHIVEPHWNEVRIQQVSGRGIRLCSHRNLPLEERYVNVYRYISISKYDTIHKIKSTDQYLMNKSLLKESINNQFLQAMKENSIDCSLNIEHTKFDKNNKNMVCLNKK